jgi:hypothetical protein
MKFFGITAPGENVQLGKVVTPARQARVLHVAFSGHRSRSAYPIRKERKSGHTP